jgi:hypothetical protein
VKLSMASTEVLAFIISLRGYVVFRFVRKDRFRAGERIVKFRDGTPLPQPFYLLARTDRRDWSKQRIAIERQYGAVEDVLERERFVFYRCNTD